MESIYAIGDIHGCYDKLLSLMKQIDADPDHDRIVFMGDYIDRGPKSYEVIEYLMALEQRNPRIVFLKGNHEEMLEKYLSGEDRMTYMVNGGQQTLESYLSHRPTGDAPLLPDDHLAFIKRLRLYYESDNYVFVHAGLRKKKTLAQQTSEDFLWIRDKFIDSRYDFGKVVVFGHTPFREPLVQGNKIGIDTGAVYGNKLTCVKLPEMVFYHE